VALPVALLVACATPSENSARTTVQRDVSERLSLAVPFEQRTPEDAQAEEALRKLLSQPLTADTAVQIALLNNRALQSLYAELGVARAGLVTAGLLSLPVFEAAVRFPVEGEHSPEWDLGVAMDFLPVVLLPLRRSVGEAGFDAARLRVASAVIDQTWQVRRAFLRLQTLASTQRLREDAAKTSAFSAEVARRLREAGNITELDYTSQAAVAAEAQIELAEATLQLRLQRERLNALLGLWGGRTNWTFVAQLPPVQPLEIALEELEGRAVASSLDLQRIERELDGAAARLGVARTQRWVPALELGAAAEREEGDWEVGPTVGIALPLWNPAVRPKAEAQAELTRLQLELYARAVALRSAARSAAQRVQIAQQRVDYYRDQVVPLRVQQVREAQLQFNAMQVGVFQLLEARRLELEARRRAIEAIEQYELAAIDLRQLLSGRMPPNALEAEAATPRTAPAGAELGVHP